MSKEENATQGDEQQNQEEKEKNLEKAREVLIEIAKTIKERIIDNLPNKKNPPPWEFGRIDGNLYGSPAEGWSDTDKFNVVEYACVSNGNDYLM